MSRFIASVTVDESNKILRVSSERANPAMGPYFTCACGWRTDFAFFVQGNDGKITGPLCCSCHLHNEEAEAIADAKYAATL